MFCFQIIALILVFSPLYLLIHETGHFLCAKIFKRKIMDFSIGIGPLVYKKGIFKLHLIPYAGYVVLEENENNIQNAYLKENLFITLSGYLFTSIITLVFFPITLKLFLLNILNIFLDAIISKESDGKIIIKTIKLLIKNRNV